MNDEPIRPIIPRWPAPANVRACATDRCGGVSRAPFASLNLGDRVGDRGADVDRNRRLLRDALGLPQEPQWLAQPHGGRVVDDSHGHSDRDADGMVTGTPGVVCAVTTADCLPILLCDRGGSRVGALHAGWRGLLSGVVQAGVAAMGVPGSDLLAWIGPAIGASAYEVGAEVRAQILRTCAGAEAHFSVSRPDHWHADLAGIAARLLRAHGVDEICACGRCTSSEPDAFFSHRRDGITGRMATLVWLQVN